MKKYFIILFLGSHALVAQVGIGTTNPLGALDVTSTNLGLVLPRVSRVEDVTNNNAGSAENGTVVYDVSRNMTCFRIANIWICLASDASFSITVPTPTPQKVPEADLENSKEFLQHDPKEVHQNSQ